MDKNGVKTGRKGLGALNKGTVLVDSSCLQAAFSKLTN